MTTAYFLFFIIGFADAVTVVPLPYDTLEQCQAAGNGRVTNSRLRIEFFCVRAPK